MTPDTDGRATARGDPPDGPNVAAIRPRTHAVAKASRLVSSLRRSGTQKITRVALVTDLESLTPDAEVPR